MALDAENVKRLQELNQRLVAPSNVSNIQNQQTNSRKQNLHPIETEENPQQLFKELMQASPDGGVPTHLIKRLKELEENQQNNKPPFLEQNNEPDLNTSSPTPNSMSPSSELYTTFKMLLLEEADGGNNN